jgi:hypothetical protein
MDRAPQLPGKDSRTVGVPTRRNSCLTGLSLSVSAFHPATFRLTPRFSSQSNLEFQMSNVAHQRAYVDDLSRKSVEKIDHLDGTDEIKLPNRARPTPDGHHHHFIPLSWIDHVDQPVHLNKTGADVTSHWQHEGRGQ